MDTDANCVHLFTRSQPLLVGHLNTRQLSNLESFYTWFTYEGKTGHDKISGFCPLESGANHLLHHLTHPNPRNAFWCQGKVQRDDWLRNSANPTNPIGSNRCQSNSKNRGLELWSAAHFLGQLLIFGLRQLWMRSSPLLVYSVEYPMITPFLFTTSNASTRKHPKTLIDNHWSS